LSQTTQSEVRSPGGPAKSAPGRKFKVIVNVLGTRPQPSGHGDIIDPGQIGPAISEKFTSRDREAEIQRLIDTECIVAMNDDGTFTEPELPGEMDSLYKRLAEQRKVMTPDMLPMDPGIHRTVRSKNGAILEG
jgi:hypothetical protein